MNFSYIYCTHKFIDVLYDIIFSYDILSKLS